MKIQEVVLAAIICSYIQIADTSNYDEFIDPTDMEHYDQRSKSSKFTLKEKVSQNIFKEFLQRLLKSAQSWHVNIRDEKLGVVYTEMEIEKFLNNEDWDADKLKLILQNVDFTKDEGVNLWPWTLFLSCVISCALTWIMNRYWTRPDQKVEANTPNEQDEEDFCFPVADTGLNEHVHNVRRESHSEPAAKQHHLDKRPSKSFQKTDTSAQGENQDESNKPGAFTSVGTKADTYRYRENNQRFHSGFLPDSSRHICEVLSNSEPAAKQDQLDKRPSKSFQKSDTSAQGENQDESNTRDAFTSVGTKADSLSNVQNIPELVTTLRDMESTDSPNYHMELLSSDAEGTSKEKVNVDTGLDTHGPQDTSMSSDYESDFILISESAPGSLTFDQDGDSDESA